MNPTETKTETDEQIETVVRHLYRIIARADIDKLIAMLQDPRCPPLVRALIGEELIRKLMEEGGQASELVGKRVRVLFEDEEE